MQEMRVNRSAFFVFHFLYEDFIKTSFIKMRQGVIQLFCLPNFIPMIVRIFFALYFTLFSAKRLFSLSCWDIFNRYYIAGPHLMDLLHVTFSHLKHFKTKQSILHSSFIKWITFQIILSVLEICFRHSLHFSQFTIYINFSSPVKGTS